ncbi:MAG: T9SS type A sorting domain-containing protein, partial [Phycisphaerae bacterium]|nr:T9SS type A sorting domain-containing protein [Saprospiraceae bacterium]
YNLIGKELYAESITIQDSGAFATIIELPNELEAGIYLLKIDSDDKTFTKKIVLH